jgi:hypothetical protein
MGEISSLYESTISGQGQLYILIQELLCPAGKLLVCAKEVREFAQVHAS